MLKNLPKAKTSGSLEPPDEQNPVSPSQAAPRNPWTSMCWYGSSLLPACIETMISTHWHSEVHLEQVMISVLSVYWFASQRPLEFQLENHNILPSSFFQSSPQLHLHEIFKFGRQPFDTQHLHRLQRSLHVCLGRCMSSLLFLTHLTLEWMAALQPHPRDSRRAELDLGHCLGQLTVGNKEGHIPNPICSCMELHCGWLRGASCMDIHGVSGTRSFPDHMGHLGPDSFDGAHVFESQKANIHGRSQTMTVHLPYQVQLDIIYGITA